MVTQSFQKALNNNVRQAFYKTGFLVFAFVIFMSLLYSVALAEEPAQKKAEVSEEVLREVVATVDNNKIMLRDLIEELNKVLPRRFHGRTIKKKGDKYKERSLWNLIWEDIFYIEAKRQEIDVKKKTKKEIKNRTKKFRTKKALDKILKAVAFPPSAVPSPARTAGPGTRWSRTASRFRGLRYRRAR